MLTENGLTEVSCADGFLEQIDGRFVFNKSTKQWHKWNGKNWEIDIRDRIVSECKEYLYGLYKILPTLPNQSQQQTVFKKIQALNSRAGINNVVAITSTSALVLAVLVTVANTIAGDRSRTKIKTILFTITQILSVARSSL